MCLSQQEQKKTEFWEHLPKSFKIILEFSLAERGKEMAEKEKSLQRWDDSNIA
jgi:hypothetical protein